ncbi:hypothetical protein MATL_G00201940 [Megalops atlanticus]|uniref:G-protein coupled receptors family 1 profile domain-containing protein n=1 Tax=Megalops atlanticus TaxID=7932 RepID=A0A9D3PLN5_MEGAT|nr:hypothetical protein MATL_G00201940 [Megalops atlanticus]
MDYGAGAFLLVIAVLSMVGNVLVLVTAFKRFNHMKPPELLSVNLAFTDLGAAVTMYPLAIASAWNHGWLGGEASCIYYGLMGFFFGVASISTLTIMAVVRFIVSLSLQSPKEKISKRNMQVLVLCSWLYALLWALFPVLGWGKYGPEPFGTACSIAWGEITQSSVFIFSMFSMNLVIPATVIIVCYFGLALKLHIAYKSLNNSNQIPNVIRMQRKLVTIAVLISVGFIGSWTPYAIVSLWSIFHSSESIPPEVSILPCFFAKTSTVYNPLIYYLFSKNFKREVKELRWLCGRSNVPDATMQGNVTDNHIYAMCNRVRVKTASGDQSERKKTEMETKLNLTECQ